MNGRPTNWRDYTSTLGLAIHVQRTAAELLEAAHTGDADVLIERSAETTLMLRAMVADLGVTPEDLEEAIFDDGIEASTTAWIARARLLVRLCKSLGVAIPIELHEVPG